LKEVDVKLNADNLALIIYALEDTMTEHKRILAAEERKLQVGKGKEPNPDHTYNEIDYHRLQIGQIKTLLSELSQVRGGLISG